MIKDPFLGDPILNSAFGIIVQFADSCGGVNLVQWGFRPLLEGNPPSE